MKRLLFLFVLNCVIWLMSGAQALAQCPMCRTAVETARRGGSGTKVGAGLNDGIIYLLTVPYLAVGVIAFIWYRKYKAHKAAV